MAKEKPIQKEKTNLFDSDYHLIDIHCPKCGTYVPAANININNTLGKCEECNSVFNFDKDPAFFNKRRGRPEVIMPKGTEVLKLRESLDIQINWFRSVSKGKLSFLTLFGILWNAIVLPMAIVMILSGVYQALLAMSLHLIVGIVMLLWVAAYFFNETQITVTSKYIDIDYSPVKLPFKKAKRIYSKDITQLYVSKYTTNVSKNGVPQKAYGLFAVLYNGEKIPIIKEMNKDTMLYLEQEIERFLDIDDQKVSGEILS